MTFKKKKNRQIVNPDDLKPKKKASRKPKSPSTGQLGTKSKPKSALESFIEDDVELIDNDEVVEESDTTTTGIANIKITDTAADEPEKLLDPKITKYFKETLGFKEFTRVQKYAIKYFVNRYDCIVQAPTGSGKTLAYSLPLIHILNAKRGPVNENKCEILAVILAPSRELVAQIVEVLKPLADIFDYNVIKLVGGGGSKHCSDKPFKKQCIVVATPPRFDHVLNKFPNIKPALKALEMLIVDEADRFADDEFRTSVTSLLGCMPKQRHTGLFSATQAREIEELLKFGLRNPVRLTLSAEEVKVGETSNDIKKHLSVEAAPKELKNYYACVEAEYKLLALVNFLNENPTSKILVFLGSSFCVDYFHSIIPNFINDKKRIILGIHRKKQAKRQQIINVFRSTKRAVLLATDLMARGLDITDIDWVVQFDIPKQSSWFIHKAGRTARLGREGKALVLLNKEEEAYVEFIQNYEHIKLHELKIDGLNDEKAAELRDAVRNLNTMDREILLNGTRAFTSFIESYVKHDCKIVCRLGDQNIAGIAHSYGILRMPIVRELRGRHDVVENFVKSGVNTLEIAFKDPKLEAVRQKQIVAAQAQKKAQQGKIDARKQKTEEKSNKRKFAEATEVEPDAEMFKKQKKSKQLAEWEELKTDSRQLRNFKKGKLTKTELYERL